MSKQRNGKNGSAGFSLIELMVALGVTLVIMAISAQMLASSMRVRTRENSRIEAIGDVQRALQVMTREIGNAGFGLANNGLHPTDSTPSQIRVRSNLNAFSGDTDTSDSLAEGSEDVVFAIINNYTGTELGGQKLITRQDVNLTVNNISQLANRVDSLEFQYLKADGTTAASVALATRVRILVGVNMPAVGSRGAPGYQPASRVQLTSDVTLRNRLLDQ
jgi:prepilin-type N-terminal cleavage/methylation domain-containing protein